MADRAKAPVSGRAAGGSEEKAKALETALAQIKKQFGEGAVMRLGQDSALNLEVIPTGSLSLDLALGVGGSPAAGSSRSTGLSPRARPRWPCTASPRRKR